MQRVGNSMTVEHPRNAVSNGAKDLGCRPQAKWQCSIQVGVPIPANTKEVVIIRVNWDEAVRILEIYFNQFSPPCTMATALSTEAYFKEQRSLAIPSLTLLPVGVERSTIRRNLLIW